ASAGDDGTVKLFDGLKGTLLKSVALGAPAWSLALSADGKRLAGGGADGLARLIDPASGKVLATLLSVDGGWLWLPADGKPTGDPATLKLLRTK
ncbi:MAG: hypothetical protein K2W96_07195, partial [Gemmataceae bacterium]|nr:hypothetical protein [Gemmataceae bacterium]